jgi:hypothetical protein
MTAGRFFQPEEPSQEALDFQKEIMKLRFPLVKDRHPEKITTRIQDGQVILDVWSDTNQWIMSEETSVTQIIEIGERIEDPQFRARMLKFFC